VKGNRVVSLKGNPEHGHTRGFLCPKVYRYPDRVYHPHRVLYPMQKNGGQWKRVGWDQALDQLAGKIGFFQDHYGLGSIMHFQRSASWGATKHLVRRFFNLLGGVTGTKGSLCAGSVMAAQQADMGTRLGNDPEDLLNSKMVVIWGRDPAKSCIHYLPILKAARLKGAHLTLIDPVRTKTALLCGEHVAPRPGSDGYLAIGMAKEILRLGLADSSFIENHTVGYTAYLKMIEAVSQKEISKRCGLEWSGIASLARSYGESRPASIFLGYGINKWVHSADMIRLIDAVGALTGNIGKPGGGVNHGFQTKRHFDMKLLAPEAIRFRRDIPEPMLGQGILEAKNPPIKMIWINGSNPVVSCPNSSKVIRALRSLDFVVVVDHFMTDTADQAHLFLPTTTFLEEEDVVVSWGHNWIGPVNQVIEPLGECRSDLHIIQALAERLGLGENMAGTTRDWLKRFLQPMERAGLTLERVMESPVRCPVAPMVAFEDRKFMTPSGKFEFVKCFREGTEIERPYHLLTVLGEKWLNSSILEEDHPKLPRAFVHPVLAAEKGIGDESKILVRSRTGELLTVAQCSETVRKDTVVIPHGTWIKRGGAANQLTDDVVSTSGDMAAYYSTTVTIESKAE